MKKTVALIYGGQSHEHEVSHKSAATFLNQIDYTKYEVIPMLITKNGEWIKYNKITEPVDSLNELSIDSINSSPLCAFDDTIDVFFPLIHGETGEDGKLQGFLEMIKKPYAGCDVESSAVSMNKITAKVIANTLGNVPVVPYQTITIDEWKNSEKLDLKMNFPLFIKPSRAGSSVGVSKVVDEKELEKALKLAFEIDTLVLIEKAINAREVEVGVIGKRDKVEVSVVGEITYASEFYDYENKYNNDNSKMNIPAHIQTTLSEDIRKYAERTYLSLGCNGYARVDFFIDKDTNEVYFNEINTSPGMTSKSMFPVLFGNQYSFTELLSKIIENAEARMTKKSEFPTLSDNPKSHTEELIEKIENA